MASPLTRPSHHHHSHAKSSSKSRVKPILKKLHSHSEKNSLDLDRSWHDQEPSLGYVATPDDASPGPRYYAGPDALFGSSTSSLPPADAFGLGFSLHSRKDVLAQPTTTTTTTSSSRQQPPSQLQLPTSTAAAASSSSSSSSAAAATAVSPTSPISPISPTSSTPVRAFAHARSASGASHASIATSISRNGSFVHPFQQNPQTSTPPLLSYTNSRPSLDTAIDCSPTIAEDYDSDDYDDALDARRRISCDVVRRDGARSSFTIDGFPSGSATPTGTTTGTSTPRFGTRPTLPHSHRSASYVRPSLAHGRRSGSLTAETPPTPGSINTLHQQPTRLSDIQLGGSGSTSTGGATVIDDPSSLLSTTITGSSPSPLRHSLDMSHFRLRSRSDVDTSNRQEQVRQARRRFEEKERAKDEKYAQRKRTSSRIGSFTTVADAGQAGRPQMSRRSTAHSRGNRPSEEVAAASLSSNSSGDLPAAAHASQTATAAPAAPQRRATAKHKTTGAWTAFVLWFRTRLLKIGRR